MPASTRISAGLKRVQGHSSPVNMTRTSGPSRYCCHQGAPTYPPRYSLLHPPIAYSTTIPHYSLLLPPASQSDKLSQIRRRHPVQVGQRLWWWALCSVIGPSHPAAPRPTMHVAQVAAGGDGHRCRPARPPSHPEHGSQWFTVAHMVRSSPGTPSVTSPPTLDMISQFSSHPLFHHARGGPLKWRGFHENRNHVS